MWWSVQQAYDTLGHHSKDYENNNLNEEIFSPESSGAVLFDDNYVVMQFTGLHDKNGKEIYEGDIIKWGVHVGAVKWINSCIVFGDGFGLFPCNLTSEIIGNIYENPELLGSK